MKFDYELAKRRFREEKRKALAELNASSDLRKTLLSAFDGENGEFIQSEQSEALAAQETSNADE